MILHFAAFRRASSGPTSDSNLTKPSIIQKLVVSFPRPKSCTSPITTSYKLSHLLPTCLSHFSISIKLKALLRLDFPARARRQHRRRALRGEVREPSGAASLGVAWSDGGWEGGLCAPHEPAVQGRRAGRGTWSGGRAVQGRRAGRGAG